MIKRSKNPKNDHVRIAELEMITDELTKELMVIKKFLAQSHSVTFNMGFPLKGPEEDNSINYTFNKKFTNEL